MTDDERSAAVLQALVKLALAGNRRARRFIGRQLGLRHAPTDGELRAMAEEPSAAKNGKTLKNNRQSRLNSTDP